MKLRAGCPVHTPSAGPRQEHKLAQKCGTLGILVGYRRARWKTDAALGGLYPLPLSASLIGILVQPTLSPDDDRLNGS